MKFHIFNLNDVEFIFKGAASLPPGVRRPKGSRGKQGLALYIDCKTRWGSLLKMLKRFLEVLDQVHHVLVDFKMNVDTFIPSKTEIEIIKPVVQALSIVDSAGRKLGARKATLASADAIFEFMIGRLSTLNSPFANRLNGAIQTRIEQRRLNTLSTLMAFLENPNFLDSIKNLHLQYGSRNDMIQAAKELLIDLKLDQDEESEQVDSQDKEHPETEPMETVPTPPERSFSDELDDHLDKRDAQCNLGAQESSITLASIRKDFKKYEGTGSRPKTLEKVYQALRSIPPTSTGTCIDLN